MTTSRRIGLNYRRSHVTGGVKPDDFNADLVTFTAGMAKRTAPGPFAAAPIVQGKWDGTGEGDVPTLGRGNQVASDWYDNFDPYQFTFSFWITPEWDGDDGLAHYIWDDGGSIFIGKSSDNALTLYSRGSGAILREPSISTWTAGTTYYVVIRADYKNTLDGTNYTCVSIDDVHSFARTSTWTPGTPGATIGLGGRFALYSGNRYAADAIIEGLTVYRRPLFDGTYGVDVGFNDPVYGNDEIAAIYAGSAGQGPCLVTGSWDVVFCMPTDSSTGALSTGVGEGWSHPHSSNLLGAGGFMADGTYTNDGWADEGTPSAVAALAAAEKIFLGGYKVTSDAANEGIYKDITVSAGDDVVIRAIGHSDGTSVPVCILYDQDNTAEIGRITGTSGSTRTAPDVFEFAGEAPAGCTTIRVKLINSDATAAKITYWHQGNVGTNLWDDPGMEAGTAPTNVGTPTTSAQDAGQAHSGTNSWKVIADAADEGIKRAITTTSGKFYHATAWVYADTAGTVDMEGPTLQDGGTTKVTTGSNDAWGRLEFVFRATGASTDLQFTSNAAQTFYVDDVAVVECDAVSLTVTPASEANSAESTGLRVDGDDECQPDSVSRLKAGQGAFRVTVTPRHAAADWAGLGNAAEFDLDLYQDANNYIRVSRTANTVTLAFNAQGAGEQSDTYNATGAWDAAASKLLKLGWTGSKAYLEIAGVEQITITAACTFAVAFAASDVYVGSRQDGTLQGDATYAAP